MADLRPSAILKFLDAVDTDVARGRLGSLQDYLDRFPDHQDLVRREYASLEDGSPAAPEPARLLAGRYRLINSLGRGSFGEVYLAEDLQVRRRVAVKLLSGLRAFHSEWRERLEREAEASHRIEGDGHCRVYDVGSSEGVPFLVLPWIRGRSLDSLISASAARGEGPVAIRNDSNRKHRTAAVLQAIARLARTLHAAHEAGVVHRDVKPSNVLIRNDGSPILIDFGLAWLAEQEDAQSLSAALGTPAYAAPELLENTRIAPDRGLDIWGLGVVLFECLTLRRPFSSRPGVSLAESTRMDPIPRVDREHGPDVQAVLETALDRRTAHRYATAAAFAADLDRLHDGQPVSVRATGPTRRALRWSLRRKWTLAVAGALAAAILAQAFVWGREASRQEAAQRTVSGLTELLQRDLERSRQLAASGEPIPDRTEYARDAIQLARVVHGGFGGVDALDRALAELLHTAAAMELLRDDPHNPARRQHRQRAMDLALESESLLPRIASDTPRADRELIATNAILLGDAAKHSGDYATSRRHYGHALQIHQSLLGRHPDDPVLWSAVGFGFRRMADSWLNEKRFDLALAPSQSAARHLRQASERSPAEPRRLGHSANAQVQLLVVEKNLGTPVEELRARSESLLGPFERWTTAQPHEFRAWLSRYSLASLHTQLDESASGRLATIDVMEICAERMLELRPGLPETIARVASVAARRATVCLAAKDWIAAESAKDHLQDVLRDLDDADTSSKGSPKIRARALLISWELALQRNEPDNAARPLQELLSWIERDTATEAGLLTAVCQFAAMYRTSSRGSRSDLERALMLTKAAREHASGPHELLDNSIRVLEAELR